MSRPRAERFAVANRVAWRAMVALVLGLALLAGCGGSDEPSPAAGPATSITADTTSTTVDPTSTTQAPSTASSTSLPPATVPTTAAPDPEAEVKAAYLQIMDAYFRRLQHPDPADPEIAANHTGASLEAVVMELEDLERNGQYARPAGQGFPVPELQMVAVSGSSAKVSFCLIDDTQIVDSSSGKVLNAAVSSREGVAGLVYRDGRWKVDLQRLKRRWPDGEGCR